MKFCKGCQKDLEEDKFSKDQYKCKDCNRKYREENKERIKKYLDLYRVDNKEYLNEIRKEYYKKNKEEILKKTSEWAKNNRERSNKIKQRWIDKNEKYSKSYRESTKEQKREYDKQYRLKNKIKIKQYHKVRYETDSENIKKKSIDRYNNNKKAINKKQYQYKKKKLKIDPLFKLTETLRSRLYNALKKVGLKKSKKTKELVGCEIIFLKDYLKEKFKPGMTWNNYGKWHVDHIIPCVYYDLSDLEQQKKCFHYTNLQPLWGEDNVSKGSLYKGVRHKTKK